MYEIFKGVVKAASKRLGLNPITEEWLKIIKKNFKKVVILQLLSVSQWTVLRDHSRKVLL